MLEDQLKGKQQRESIFLTNKKRIIVVQKPQLDSLTPVKLDDSPGIFPVSKENLLRRIESSEHLQPILNGRISAERRNNFLNSYEKSILKAAKRNAALKFKRKSLNDDSTIFQSL